MKTNLEQTRDSPSGCNCAVDPFADLPPTLRPAAKLAGGKLRLVTCPGCGLTYWTNRATDLCVDCSKKHFKTKP